MNPIRERRLLLTRRQLFGRAAHGIGTAALASVLPAVLVLPGTTNLVFAIVITALRAPWFLGFFVLAVPVAIGLAWLSFSLLWKAWSKCVRTTRSP